MFMTGVIISSGVHTAFYIIFKRTFALHQDSKIFAKKVLRNIWYWNHEKAKKVSVVGQKKISYKIKYVYFKTTQEVVGS